MNSKYDSVAESYGSDGVVVVRGVLGIALCEALQKAIEWAEENPSPMHSDLAREHDGHFFNDFMTYRRNPYIKKIAESEELLNVGSLAVGTESIRLFHDHILIKKGLSPETPWHQDRPYYLVEGPCNYSIWMPAADVPAEEGLSFIAGSHFESTLYMPVDFTDGLPLDERGESFTSLTEEEVNRLIEKNGVRNFDVTLGDVIVFDNRIVHKARRSHRAFERAALSIRYLGDNARMTWKGVNQTPPFHRMGLNFEEGDIPDDGWFPSLRPAR